MHVYERERENELDVHQIPLLLLPWSIVVTSGNACVAMDNIFRPLLFLHLDGAM